MANENVPAPAPTRSDDQILPFIAWVPIEKSNFVLDLQKKQKNPIFQISVDILQNINFFRAFTTSASVILDEVWLRLDANLLRKSLEITPVDQAHQFMSPPSGDAIMDFVNQLGYPGEIHFVSRMAMNNLYQPWRAILSMINQCHTSKTYGFDRARYPVLQMLWGIIACTNIDYVELIWEEFVHAIQTFLVDNANLGSPTKKGKKTKPYVIPYSQFTKLIIYYLERHRNIHQRSGSPLNLAEDDLSLGNLKFVPKGKIDEVFGMQIPEELITNNIRNAPYYNAYLEMKQTPTSEEASTRPSAQPQDDTSANIVFETPSLADAETVVDMDKVISEGDIEILNIGEEQGEDVDNQGYLEEQTTVFDEGQAGSDPGKTPESRPLHNDDKMNEDQAGSEPRKSHVALNGSNPESMHDDFVATVYLKVHESLKFLADEQVIIKDPPSSSETLSSMKNLDDIYTFEDLFFNDKSTEDEPGKQNVNAKVVSMITVPIHQASTLVPPLSTPIIDLSPLKPAASPLPKPFTAATTKSQTLNNATQNLRSRVFTLKLWDLPHKIDQTINKVVKKAVHIALQALHRDRFRELPKADMKEILHQRMFKSGSYKSLPEHVALYEALEASMEQEIRDEFLAEKEKSQKRHRDDQDPPPPHPPLDSDLNKKIRHDYDSSRLK
nr:monodehydroascorbate reductase [Tanacetum cinerariifolium]